MTQRSAASCLIALLAIVGTSDPRPASAQSKAGVDEFVQGRSFDGAKTDAPIAVAMSPSVPSVGTPVGVAAASKTRTKQSGADLFYFSPEEADLGARLFAGRPDRVGATGYAFDPDVPDNIKAQMRSDLAFVGGIQGQGASPLHQQIFGSVDGSAYKRFFESHVKSVGMDDCGNSNAVACVIPYQDPSKMWLTQNYVQFSHPQIARLMIVFHEARHTETKNRNWPHASCPDPFQDADGNDMKSIWTGAILAREPACDTTPLGSYGSSAIMLKNIQKFCKSCTDKVKMDAGLYGDDQLNRIIDSGAKQQIKDDLSK